MQILSVFKIKTTIVEILIPKKSLEKIFLRIQAEINISHEFA